MALPGHTTGPSPDHPPAPDYPLAVGLLFQERVWGCEDISSLYATRPATPRRVGEVWLTSDDNRVLNGPCAGSTLGELCRAHSSQLLGGPVAGDAPQGSGFPLLVKFLFTTEKLSVQVHPSDSYARRREGSRGKTEMWHVLRAETGARLSVGFAEDRIAALASDRQALRRAVDTGDIEGMLRWTEVQAGETFFVPAGTVHAIGGGLVLCEIQQNSDITYRLYDYNRPGTDGRPRPLHVEKALEVIDWDSHGGRTQPLPLAGEAETRLCLAACPYFATERVQLKGSLQYEIPGRFEIWIGLEGEAELEASGQSCRCRQGEVVVIPAAVRELRVQASAPSVFLRTYGPDLEKDVIAPLRASGVTEEQLSKVCFPLQSGDERGAA